MNAYTELSVAADLMSQGKNTDSTDLVTAEDYTNALNDLKEFVKAFEDAKPQQPEVDPEALAAAKEAYDAIHLKYATIGVSYMGYAYEDKAVAAIIDELMEAVEWFPSEANPTIEQYNTVTATAIAAMEDAEAKLAELLPDFTAALAEVDEMIAKCNEVAKEYGQVAASGTAAGDKMSDLVDTAYGYGFYLARPTNVEEAKIAVSTMKDAIKAFYESCTIQILVNVIEEGAENALEKVEAIKAGILQTMDADETKE